MSSPPQVRRTDKLMADSRAREMLERGFCGRLATVGATLRTGVGEADVAAPPQPTRSVHASNAMTRFTRP